MRSRFSFNSRTSCTDCGIAITQQHGWPLIQNVTTLDDITRQIQRHLDWLFLPFNNTGGKTGAGFDFLSTESGFSEFTRPDCTQMLSWMNITTGYAMSKHNKVSSHYLPCNNLNSQLCRRFTSRSIAQLAKCARTILIRSPASPSTSTSCPITPIHVLGSTLTLYNSTTGSFDVCLYSNI